MARQEMLVLVCNSMTSRMTVTAMTAHSVNDITPALPLEKRLKNEH